MQLSEIAMWILGLMLMRWNAMQVQLLLLERLTLKAKLLHCIFRLLKGEYLMLLKMIRIITLDLWADQVLINIARSALKIGILIILHRYYKILVRNQLVLSLHIATIATKVRALLNNKSLISWSLLKLVLANMILLFFNFFNS